MDTGSLTVAHDPMTIEQRRTLLLSELERIRVILAGVPSIRQVLVFGSVATGDVHEWSDLDLVIVQDTTARFLDRTQILTDLIRPKVATQFLVYTPRELTEIAYRPFVRHEMLQKGKALSMDHKTDADRWLTFASDDVRVARLALGEEIWSQVCFHSQQCVEKCLKGLLARTGQLLARTHVIADLWDAQTADTRRSVGDLEAGLKRLDRFYIPTRYPDATPGSLAEGLPGREDAEEALTTAEECLGRSRAIVDPPPVATTSEAR